MTKRDHMSFRNPSFLKTNAERAIAEPIIGKGVLAYEEFGWQLTGQRFTYLCRPPKLAELTIELLKALDRVAGGLPCRDHREARLQDVHYLILSAITRRHQVRLPNGRRWKMTASQEKWVATTPP